MLTSEIMAKDQPCVVRPCCFSYEYRNSQATAMSVDWTGQWVLLAGRRHLTLQQLGCNEEYSLRKYSRHSKYEVSAAEWGVCQNSKEYCAIATSQLIEVVTLGTPDITPVHSLRAHTRVITDIDWHSKDPHLLASCSIDTFTHLWDLRDARRPSLSLSAVCMSGATQVGFNRVSGNLLAAAHDGDLRIWDIRKGSSPIHYITAHLTRVHGINWSHNKETCLATASQDGTVKYFDVNNPRRAEKIITTSSPVWRARYTPIGNGLVTVVVPHLGRGENSLLLWSNSKQSEPVCSFFGHTDVILDFAWRPNHSNSSELELVTWSRDQTLKLWKIDEPLFQMCKADSPETDDEGISLHHEFSLLNTNIPHVEVDVLDAIKRCAIIKVSAGGHVVILEVKFPNEYPSPNIYPQFTFGQLSTIDGRLSEYIMKTLESTAHKRVKCSRACLEQCIRAVVTALKKKTGATSKEQIRLQSPRLEGALSGALHDACIPFPRISSVRFNSTGHLVTFAQNLNRKRITLRNQNVTPKALSAISGGLLGNVMGSQPVLYAHKETSSSYYFVDRLNKSSKYRNLTHKTTSNLYVQIYDANKLLNLNKEMAEQFVIKKSDIKGTCRDIKKLSESHGRFDLVPIWELAELIAADGVPNESNCEMLFYKDPFKRSVLESLIMHFATNGDLQTAVMLCCVFHKCSPDNEAIPHGNRFLALTPSGSPYHTVLPVDNTNTSFNIQSLAMQLKHLRSNSWSDSLDWDDSKLCANDSNSCSYISKSKMALFDNFKKVYGEILFGWQLLSKRTMILKYVSHSKVVTQGVDFVTECSTCNKISKTTCCAGCRKPVMYCTLCRLPVKGASNACLACGHGGHVSHMQKWFQAHEMCASGCGCYCISGTADILDQIG